MTRRNIYLLVPSQGIGWKGIDPAKIEVVGGRANAIKRGEALERELNGGHLASDMVPPQFTVDQFRDAWRVHVDTDNSWASSVYYRSWNVDARVEALLDS